ncbi:MAG: 1-acyl-sn-glycerol-3-phosphate acyltransferase [Bryobacteraceae bacterium]
MSMHDIPIRLVLWLVAKGLFRPRVRGTENIPANGPALLAANHVTYVDGFLIWYFIPRDLHFIVWEPFFKVWSVAWALRYIRAIPVADSGPRSLRETMRRARHQLDQGQLVCIFPEGSITRNGEMQSFRRGMELIVNGSDTPIIPVHLDGLWGNLFSFDGGRPFSKWPKHLRHPATVTFGKPMPAQSTPDEVRAAIERLAAEGQTQDL